MRAAGAKGWARKAWALEEEAVCCVGMRKGVQGRASLVGACVAFCIHRHCASGEFLLAREEAIEKRTL